MAHLFLILHGGGDILLGLTAWLWLRLYNPFLGGFMSVSVRHSLKKETKVPVAQRVEVEVEATAGEAADMVNGYKYGIRGGGGSGRRKLGEVQVFYWGR